MRRTIIVMVGTPASCMADQQSDPPMETKTAERLQECLLLDVLDKAQSTPDAEVIVACAPDGTSTHFRDATNDANGYTLHREFGTEATVDVYFEQTCEPGRSVVALQSEYPTLPAMCLELAFDVLDTCRVDIVLGPSEDGRCYLVGMNRYHPGLLSGIDLNSQKAIESIIERSADNGLDWYLLPEWHSIDSTADPAGLRDELLERSEKGPSTKHTRAFLHQLENAECGVWNAE